MKTIYKYTLNHQSSQKIQMPKRHDILHVQYQDGVLAMWALVDTSTPMVDQEFIIVGTGRNLDSFPPCQYVGTALIGSYVWHVFKVTDDGTTSLRSCGNPSTPSGMSCY